MFEYLKNKNILVISNDAGGANQIYFFLKYEKINFKLFAKGPAINIFNKKIKNEKNINDLINKSEIILFGSGTGFTEYNLLQKSSINKKYTIVFLENWVNFRERIERKKNSYLPNEIWVSDQPAFELAKKYFKDKLKIKKIKNYYLESFKKKKSIVKKKNKIIYLSPNYNMNGVTNGYRKKLDFKILKVLISKIDIIKKIINKNIEFIDVLLHPSEEKDKYNYFQLKYPKKIRILKNKKLNEILFKYKYAISTNSYSLLISKKIGLVTFNNIKKTGIKSTIPSIYVDHYI